MSSFEVIPAVIPQYSSDKDDGNGKNGASLSPNQLHVTNDSAQNYVRLLFALFMHSKFMSMLREPSNQFCLQTF